ncbi:MAG TPA: tetratricopeptide repeat protein, partial [Dongiaceae bacterium]|nr:tetratricopeptide repeat protein [Dongiaceae bacterium]
MNVRTLCLTAVCALLSLPAMSSSTASPEAAKLNHQGLEHLQKKQYDQAIVLFRQALQLQPEFPEA